MDDRAFSCMAVHLSQNAHCRLKHFEGQQQFWSPSSGFCLEMVLNFVVMETLLIFHIDPSVSLSRKSSRYWMSASLSQPSLARSICTSWGNLESINGARKSPYRSPFTSIAAKLLTWNLGQSSRARRVVLVCLWPSGCRQCRTCAGCRTCSIIMNSLCPNLLCCKSQAIGSFSGVRLRPCIQYRFQVIKLHHWLKFGAVHGSFKLLPK